MCNLMIDVDLGSSDREQSDPTGSSSMHSRNPGEPEGLNAQGVLSNRLQFGSLLEVRDKERRSSETSVQQSCEIIEESREELEEYTSQQSPALKSHLLLGHSFDKSLSVAADLAGQSVWESGPEAGVDRLPENISPPGASEERTEELNMSMNNEIEEPKVPRHSPVGALLGLLGDDSIAGKTGEEAIDGVSQADRKEVPRAVVQAAQESSKSSLEQEVVDQIQGLAEGTEADEDRERTEDKETLAKSGEAADEPNQRDGHDVKEPELQKKRGRKAKRKKPEPEDDDSEDKMTVEKPKKKRIRPSRSKTKVVAESPRLEENLIESKSESEKEVARKVKPNYKQIAKREKDRLLTVLEHFIKELPILMQDMQKLSQMSQKPQEKVLLSKVKSKLGQSPEFIQQLNQFTKSLQQLDKSGGGETKEVSESKSSKQNQPEELSELMLGKRITRAQSVKMVQGSQLNESKQSDMPAKDSTRLKRVRQSVKKKSNSLVSSQLEILEVGPDSQIIPEMRTIKLIDELLLAGNPDNESVKENASEDSKRLKSSLRSKKHSKRGRPPSKHLKKKKAKELTNIEDSPDMKSAADDELSSTELKPIVSKSSQKPRTRPTKEKPELRMADDSSSRVDSCKLKVSSVVPEDEEYVEKEIKRPTKKKIRTDGYNLGGRSTSGSLSVPKRGRPSNLLKDINQRIGGSKYISYFLLI